MPVTPVAEALRQSGIPFAILSGSDKSLTGNELLITAMRLQKPAPLAAIREVLNKLCQQLGD